MILAPETFGKSSHERSTLSPSLQEFRTLQNTTKLHQLERFLLKMKTFNLNSISAPPEMGLSWYHNKIPTTCSLSNTPQISFPVHVDLTKYVPLPLTITSSPDGKLNFCNTHENSENSTCQKHEELREKNTVHIVWLSSSFSLHNFHGGSLTSSLFDESESSKV